MNKKLLVAKGVVRSSKNLLARCVHHKGTGTSCPQLNRMQVSSAHLLLYHRYWLMTDERLCYASYDPPKKHGNSTRRQSQARTAGDLQSQHAHTHTHIRLRVKRTISLRCLGIIGQDKVSSLMTSLSLFFLKGSSNCRSNMTLSLQKLSSIMLRLACIVVQKIKGFHMSALS